MNGEEKERERQRKRQRQRQRQRQRRRERERGEEREEEGIYVYKYTFTHTHTHRSSATDTERMGQASHANFSQICVTYEEWQEKGPHYLAEHRASNRYIPTPAPLPPADAN